MMSRTETGKSIMTNLADIIHEIVTEKVTEDAVRQEVAKHVEKFVVDVISSQMRQYSDVGKAIEKALTESLRVDHLNLPSYGAMVQKLLKSQIEATVQPLIAGRLAEDMQQLLTLAPKTVKLSEIVKEMLEGCSAYQDGQTGDLVTCIVERTEYGSIWVYLDDDHHYPDREKYQSSTRLLIKEDGTISSGTCDTGDIGISKQSGKRITFGRGYGLAQKVMSFYACGTVIEIDEDSVSTYRDYD